MGENMLYYLLPHKNRIKNLSNELAKHPQIKFVSLIAIDLGNNHTDERIPIENMLSDINSFFKHGVQTDGSSVNLPKIADINNAKVDIIPDCNVKWYVDYNSNNIHEETGKPIGTLIIPAFLEHNGKRVGSRATLQRAITFFENEILNLFKENPHRCEEFDISSPNDIESINLTAATELEFWVKTPDHRSDIEKLSTSEHLKEQYWKRTVGPVRTSLEKSLQILDKYGLNPEMGHKEVGGVASKLKGTNHWVGVMEQIEIDWKYDNALQTADNEWVAKNIIKDTFEQNGLIVNFDAKPIEGVAGSGEHHHVGAIINLKDGKKVNLFSPKDMKKEFLNTAGWGALMGIMKNYEIINPFITSTNDAFNRLKPGYEAPVCTVASIGHSPDIPSRNRTVLIGLVRDIDNKYSTRFELRSPNPHTNSYLCIASVYMSIFDGIKTSMTSNLNSLQLAEEFMKPYGEDKFYLEKNREYRSEKNVFADYTDEQRDKFFSKPPKTVWENVQNFNTNLEKKEILLKKEVFTNDIIKSYECILITQWITELKNRIIPSNTDVIRRVTKQHTNDNITDLDVINWEQINAIRFELLKDSVSKKSLFSQIRDAIDAKDYNTVSNLQLIMSEKMNLLISKYNDYKHNLLTEPQHDID